MQKRPTLRIKNTDTTRARKTDITCKFLLYSFVSMLPDIKSLNN